MRYYSWQNAIYSVDNLTAPLHTSVNKGKESNVYLTYIIENYESLPSTIVFLHAHRDGWPIGWHNDANDYSNVWSVRNLQVDFIQEKGYANLRCLWVPGCPSEIEPFRQRNNDGERHVPQEIFSGVWKYMFGDLEVPEIVGTPCCSQFAVSKTQVLQRLKEDYIRYRNWVWETPEDDEVSGRVMEYLWHIIFGREPV